MARWTYLATDLRTGAALEEIPLTAVSFGRSLNGGGSFQATLPLSAQIRKDTWAATCPGKTMVWSFRNGVPVGAHILWTREPDFAGQVAQIRGSEPWSYFGRRLITSPVEWIETDTAVAAAQLVEQAQQVVGGNIQVQVPGGTLSGVRVTRTVYSSDDRTVAEEIESLSGLGVGFTFDIVPRLESGDRQLRFVVNPGGGRLAAKYPGNARSVTMSDDASALATAIKVQGGGSSDSLHSVVGYTTYGDALDLGYPLLESVVSAPSITNTASLTEYLSGVAAARRLGVQYGSVVVGHDNPALGTYWPGDRVRVMVDSGPVSQDRWLTLLGYDVQVGGSEDSVTWRVTDQMGGGA